MELLCGMFDGQVKAPANEIAGATGSGRTIAAWRTPEDAAGTDTGDEIAGATDIEVKLRAERKLGGRAEALPHITCDLNCEQF